MYSFRGYDFLQREQLTDYTFCLSLNFKFFNTRLCRRCRQRGVSTAVPKKDKQEKRQVYLQVGLYISELLNRLGLEEPQEGYLKKKGDIQHQFKMISRRRIQYKKKHSVRDRTGVSLGFTLMGSNSLIIELSRHGQLRSGL